MPTPPAPGTELFIDDDLTDWLGRTVSSGKAVMVEQVVWGWLKPVLGLSVRPVPLPDEVFSWAIELGAIAHENPSGLSSQQLGPAQQAFSSERRAEILAAAGGGAAPGAPAGPLGCFPDAQAWPDPARIW